MLTNVRIDCWHDKEGGGKAHDTQKFSKVIVRKKGTSYYYEAYKAGNANAFDENGNRKSNYLAMGINGYHDNQL